MGAASREALERRRDEKSRENEEHDVIFSSSIGELLRTNCRVRDRYGWERYRAVRLVVHGQEEILLQRRRRVPEILRGT